MKRLIIMTTVLMSFLLSTEPDPRGNWKLSGLAVDYLHIARETTPFFLTVDYPELAGTSFSSSSDCAYRVDGDGNPTGDDSGTLVQNPNATSVCIHLQDIPAGVMFNRLTNGPFTNTGLGGIGVNLNVNIYDGGNGTIAQGSFYPDIELSESQDCVTDLQIFAVNENFSWEVGTQSTFDNSNVLGMDNGLLCLGDDEDTVAAECDPNNDEAWGFGLVTGLFDETPSTPVPVRVPPYLPYVALTDGTVLGLSCGAWCLGGGTAAVSGASQAAGGPEVDDAGCIATCGSWDYATAAAYGSPGWLSGTGTSSKFNINQGASAMCDTPGCNPDVDFKLVWDALDSEETGLGFGDDPDVDEDGDGTPYDRIFGVPYIDVTHLNTTNPLCDISGGSALGNPFTLPVAGDILSQLGATVGCDDVTTVSGQQACQEQVVAGFISDGCFNTVLDGVEAGCLAQVSAGVEQGCLDLTLAGTIAQCEGDGTGTPGAFAAGLCVDAAGSDDLQAVCNADVSLGGGWENAVIGLCMSLDVDAATCAAAASGAGQIFDAYYANANATATAAADAAAAAATDAQAAAEADPDNTELAPAATAAAAAATAAATAAALAQGAAAASECDLLADDDFGAGACGAVVGGLITETDCTVWAADLSDSFLNAAAETATGADCPTTSATLAAGLAAGDATAIATLNGMALSATGADCPTTAATLAAGYASDDATTFAATVATLDPMAMGVIGMTCSDYGTNFTDDCLETAGEYNLDTDTEMYLFKPGAGLDTWGNFFTYNGAVFSSLASVAGSMNDNGDALSLIPCNGSYDSFPLSSLTADDDTNAALISGFVATCNPHLMVNDSKWDFDSASLTDPSYDGNLGGRLTMTFEPTCVRELEARQIVAEFVDLTDLCDHSGDVDYSCAAYDWNYNFLADVDEDGIDAADCEAFATATDQAYVVNNGYVLPSCDDEITTNCTEYSATVVWNAVYNMCGDGDPNDLIDLGPDGFCALAVPTGAFGDPAGAAAMPTCLGYYDLQGGIPSFEQNCTVGDGTVSVTDVVRIINHIIGNDSSFGDSVDQLGGEAACEADYNDDGNINVVDVVAIVNYILSSQGGRVADASEASISIENDKIVINADGYIGAVDMIVEFTDNFSFDIADGFASTSRVNGNRAHIILIGDKDGISDVLTMTSGKIVGIEEVLVANSSDFVTTSINQPSIFSVGAAYPNPFNPSTNISLVLNANADLSVKVYNLTGQLVDVIAEGNYSPSSYNWTWKAENLASGVYFIKAQVGSEVSTQKVMLLK